MPKRIDLIDQNRILRGLGNLQMKLTIRPIVVFTGLDRAFLQLKRFTQRQDIGFGHRGGREPGYAAFQQLPCLQQLEQVFPTDLAAEPKFRALLQNAYRAVSKQGARAALSQAMQPKNDSP